MFDVSTEAIQSGFGFLVPLGLGAMSAFGNWLGGRQKSKMHDASIAANEAIDMRRSQDWRHAVAQQMMLNREHLERQRGALNALGGAGIAGLPAGFDLGALASPAGGIMPRAGGGSMLTATPDIGGGGGDGGIFGGDSLGLLAMALGNRGAGDSPGVLPTTPTGAIPYLPAGPHVTGSNPRSMMGGGNLRVR